MRRQWPALVLVPVLAAASVLWTLRLDWFPYLDRQPRDLTTVAVGEAGRFGGASFTVTETRRVAGDSGRGADLAVAPDATLVVVTIDVEPGEQPTGCLLEAVDEETRWAPASFSETDYSVPDRFESYCDSEATQAYALQVLYVVPTTVADDVELELSESELQPPELRLELGS